MIRPRLLAPTLCAVFVAAAATVHADVKTQERTRFELGGMLGKIAGMFGGKAAREGVVTTIAIKGSRMSTMGDSTGQIIDLSEEKVYDIDVRRKTYRVMTFAQIRQQMEEARAKAEKAAREEQAKQKEQPQDAKNVEQNVEFDLDVSKTGQSRTINGFATNQSIVTVTVREKGKTLDQSGGLQVITDMWLAPQMPAMKELVDFQLRYAKQLYGPMVAGASPQDMATALAIYPMLKPALERMNAEASKLEGTAILTAVKVEGVKSAEQLAAEQKQREQSNQPGISGGVGGLLGGLAKRAAQKKVEGDPAQRAMVMTTTSEILKIVTDVSATDVEIPAGFKQQ